MAVTDLPSPEELRQLLRYDPETGLLFWRSRGIPNWDARYAGAEALNSPFRGYVRGKVAGVNVRAHRIIWAIVYGEWPDQVDHINGVRSDNRISNLRDVSNQENAMNRRYRPNSSGITGVVWDQRSGKWKAHMKLNGKYIFIGLFADKDAAAQARKSAEEASGFHKNHGRT